MAGRLRYRTPDGKLRYVKDTPGNRAKYAGRIVEDHEVPRPGRRAKRQNEPATRPESVTAPGVKPQSQSQAQGDEAARAAVTGPAASTDGTTQQPQPQPQVSYAAVVKTVNAILSMQAPDYRMLPDEEQNIGQSLDLVVEKYAPTMKNAGPEFALTVAVVGYVVRILLAKMKQPKPKTEAAYPPGSERGPDPDGPRKPTGSVPPLDGMPGPQVM